MPTTTITIQTTSENEQEEYDSDCSHKSDDDDMTTYANGRVSSTVNLDAPVIAVTVYNSLEDGEDDAVDDNDNNNHEDNEDDDKDNNSNQLPQIEHVLRPAVIPLTCQRCRSTIHIITKSNPRYDPVSTKQKQQEEQELQQQLLQQQQQQQSNTHSPPKTPLSQSKFSNSLTRSGFLTRRKSIHQASSSSSALGSKNNSRVSTPRGTSSASLSQSLSGSQSSSSLQSMTNNTTMAHSSSVTSLTTTLTRVRSTSNSSESQYALNVAANQRKFTILRDYPYQLISQEEYEQHLDYLNNKLFGYASDKAHVDELCVECLEAVIAERDREYQTVHSEVEAYQTYLSGLQLTNAGDDAQCDEEALMEELQKLEEEEKEWKKKLEKLQEEEAKADYADHLLKQEEQGLIALEHKYWSEYNHFQLKLNAFQQERDALQQQLLSVSRMLDKLNASNALNDSFHIWFEGHFATINNFRLGRLQTQPVEWNEINAAWGQAVLLLSCLAKRMNYVFKEARIIPVGSFSKMEVKRIGGWTAYELYGGQGGLFWQSKYDKAQIAFLGCIRELVDHCCQSLSQHQDSGSGSSGSDYRREIPYAIHGEQVGGISLRWGDDERWTRACKYLLTDLKWLIGIISFTEQ